MATTDTTVSNLIINKLTKAQYDAIQNPSDTELYLVPDEIDNVPTSGSSNLVKSGGVYSALADKADKSTTYTKTEVDGIVDDYLPLSGGTMTGTINLASGAGINAGESMEGLLIHKPSADWTGISNTQWGVGSGDAQGVIRSNDNDLLHYRHSTTPVTNVVLDSGNYSTYALPKSGGTMTGSLNVATGSGISDASGNGLLVYHPSTWTGVSNTQWAVGAIDSRAVVRSSDGEVLHYCGGNGKTFNVPDSLRYTLASGASTTTDISINGGYYGKTFFAIVSGHSGSGNSTMSGVYMIRCGYSGDNLSVNRISINAAGSTTVSTEPCQFSQSGGYLKISAVGYNIVVRLLCNRDFY